MRRLQRHTQTDIISSTIMELALRFSELQTTLFWLLVALHGFLYLQLFSFSTHCSRRLLLPVPKGNITKLVLWNKCSSQIGKPLPADIMSPGSIRSRKHKSQTICLSDIPSPITLAEERNNSIRSYSHKYLNCIHNCVVYSRTKLGLVAPMFSFFNEDSSPVSSKSRR